ncbi:MAG TPA: ATP-binding protein [Nocardioides sp.]|uniref:sensor histidine kinase n=1 Tax=Nocardioides sp. TaxID=35761 RepID=UPI002ED87FE4
MWSRPATRRRHLSLAGQFLVLQLAVLLVVLVVTSVVSLRQSDADFRDSREDRLRAAAESLAGIPAVRDGLLERSGMAALSFYLQTRRADVGASDAYLTDLDGRVLVATDPTRVGETLPLGGPAERAWSGDIDDVGGRAIAAQVPVYAGGDAAPATRTAPAPVGVVAVTEDYPPLTERLAHVRADVVAVLGSGLALGLLGSWLLARLIKRRTRGLEPAEIAALADHREGLLRSIREGVVAVGTDGRISLMSDSARELLGLAEDPTGRRLDDLPVGSDVRELLRGPDEVRDAVLVAGARVLVLNRNRVLHDGRPAGTVTTLRDRTELLTLQSELNARESITDTLRAQTHEFSNHLHTISGLIQLQEYDEVARFVDGLTRRRAALSDFVTARVGDPAVAALLIAKGSVAAERRVALDLDEDSALPRLDADLAADVGTVVGNLVDNAVDAAYAGATRPARVLVHVGLAEPGPDVVIRVADTGAGVAPERVAELFRRGYSTKPGGPSGRGVGLALVRVLAEGRGGSVTVHNDEALGGAVFTVRLPVAPWATVRTDPAVEPRPEPRPEEERA